MSTEHATRTLTAVNEAIQAMNRWRTAKGAGW